MSEQPRNPDDAEQPEPSDGRAPAPLWLVAVCTGLAVWGLIYLMSYSGGFRGDVLDEDATRSSLAAIDDEALDLPTLGQRVYLGYCASCHGASGQGVAGLYPPLAGAEWVTGEPARLKRILLQGPRGGFTVRGSRYFNDSMPAFGPQMSNRRLAAIATYIRQAWGNNASTIDPESIAATRRVTESRTAAWSADELMAITRDDYVAATTRAATTVPAEDMP